MKPYIVDSNLKNQGAEFDDIEDFLRHQSVSEVRLPEVEDDDIEAFLRRQAENSVKPAEENQVNTKIIPLEPPITPLSYKIPGDETLPEPTAVREQIEDDAPAASQSEGGATVQQIEPVPEYVQDPGVASNKDIKRHMKGHVYPEDRALAEANAAQRKGEIQSILEAYEGEQTVSEKPIPQVETLGVAAVEPDDEVVPGVVPAEVNKVDQQVVQAVKDAAPPAAEADAAETAGEAGTVTTGKELPNTQADLYKKTVEGGPVDQFSADAASKLENDRDALSDPAATQEVE